MERKLLDNYVNDKNLFRKAIKDCKTVKELYQFLAEIQDVKGYKLYVPNRWDIPVEDVVIYKNEHILCYFYLTGSRKYKSINGLSRVAELVKCDIYDTFSLSILC